MKDMESFYTNNDRFSIMIYQNFTVYQVEVWHDHESMKYFIYEGHFLSS